MLILTTEKSLKTHDIALSIRHSGRSQEDGLFRFIVLSAFDLKPPSFVLERIERLQHITGSNQVGIVFLLQEKDQKGNGMSEFMDLQSRYTSIPQRDVAFFHRLRRNSRADLELCSLQGASAMPILPLHALDALSSILTGFQRNHFTTRGTPVALNPAITLLPYCVIQAPSLPEKAVFRLSDACGSIDSLRKAAMTEDGKILLRDVLSEFGHVAENIIAFWEDDFMIS